MARKTLWIVAGALLLGLPSPHGATPAGGIAKPAAGCARIEDFGGGRDTADNVPAFRAWAIGLAGPRTRPTPRRCLELGAGDYVFLGGVTVVQPAAAAIAVSGMGQGITNLRFPNGGGLTFQQRDTASASSVTGLSLLTGRRGGSNAITVTNAQCLGSHATNRFVDLGFQDETGPGGPSYWEIGLSLRNVSTIVADGLNYYGQPGAISTGTGIEWSASGASDKAATGGPPHCFAIVAQVTNSNFYAAARGIVMGAYVQGLNLARDNFTNGSGIGLVAQPDSLGSNALTVESCQFNTYGPADIRLEGQMSDVHIGGGTLIYVQPGQIGLALAATLGRNFLIQGVEFAGVGKDSTGIAWTGGVHGSITGNIYETLSTGNRVAADLAVGVHHNIYDQVAVPNEVARGNKFDEANP